MTGDLGGHRALTCGWRVNGAVAAALALGACAPNGDGVESAGVVVPDRGGTPGPTPSPGVTPAPSPSAVEKVNVVRYIGGDASTWPARQNMANAISKNGGFSDLYSRFVLNPVDPERAGPAPDTAGATGPLRSYRLERRNWISRIFTEKSKAVVAVANVTVMEPDLPLTIPLYSASYASGGDKKDNWVTTLTSSDVRSPLFRITPGSRFTVNLSAKVSEDVASSGASTALSAITTAVQIAAPQSSVLTALSAEENANRAVALDRAISTLMSYSIDENVNMGRMVWSWEPNAAIMLVGCAPFVKVEGPATGNGACADGADIGGGVNALIGTWRLTLTCPQFSLFSARSICKSDNTLEDISDATKRKAIDTAIAATVADSLVLDLTMAENVSMRSFIRSSENFTGLLAETTKDAGVYGKFCATLMNDLQAQGLTGLDSALGLRATLRLMPEFVVSLADLRTKADGDGCRRLLSDHGITL